MYLLIADYYSKLYPIVEKLESTSKAIAKITNMIFSMFGHPNTIISDNGPQFIGQEYQLMVSKTGISHVTISPYHSESPGFIERMVRTVKTILTITSKQQSALLMYRTTPIGPNMPSPAEMIFGRKIQGNLPVYVKPQTTKEQRAFRENNRMRSEQWYISSSKILPELDIDDRIFYQDVWKRAWMRWVIIGKGPEPRSYTLKCITLVFHDRKFHDCEFHRPSSLIWVRITPSLKFKDQE